MRWLLQRWWFWTGTVFMLVAVCAGYLVIPIGEGRISQTNCDRIQLGWAVGEVYSLLKEHEPKHFLACEGDENWFIWHDDDENMIRVVITPQGVTEKEFVPTTLSFFERVKCRIERRIRALWP